MNKHPLVGKRVHIDWVDVFDQWHHFLVLDIRDGLLCLQGLDQGSEKYDQEVPFWVPLNTVEMITELKFLLG